MFIYSKFCSNYFMSNQFADCNFQSILDLTLANKKAGVNLLRLFVLIESRYIPIGIPPNGESSAGSTISFARSGLISPSLSLASRAVCDIGIGLSSKPFASLAVLAILK